jgi:hypothetical protein
MFEEMASGAVGMLVIMFLIMIAFIMIWGWFLKGEDKMNRRRIQVRNSSSYERRNISSDR